MIVPHTRFRLELVPIARITVSECQRRYPERVWHYVRLLSDPQHVDAHAGLVHLAPAADTPGYYTVLDGHHRLLAAIIVGRADVLALVVIEPGQRGYADEAWLAELSHDAWLVSGGGA